MIADGLNLAMFGMGAVFVFLALLILVTKLMSAMVRMLEVSNARMTPALPERGRTSQHSAAASADEAARLKAILSAAVKQYKSKN